MPWPCCSHCSAFCCGNNHHNWIITIPFFWFQMQQSSEHSRTCSILLALDSIFSGQSSKTGDISRLQELLWVMLTWLYHVIPTNNLKHPQAFKLTSTFYFRAFRSLWPFPLAQAWATAAVSRADICQFSRHWGEGQSLNHRFWFFHGISMYFNYNHPLWKYRDKV